MDSMRALMPPSAVEFSGFYEFLSQSGPVDLFADYRSFDSVRPLSHCSDPPQPPRPISTPLFGLCRLPTRRVRSSQAATRSEIVRSQDERNPREDSSPHLRTVGSGPSVSTGQGPVAESECRLLFLAYEGCFLRPLDLP